MKTTILLRKYVWLLNTILSAGKISLEEINRKWLLTEMSNGVPLSRSTFNRHKDDILEIFDIIIDCDKKDGYKYFISNAEFLEKDNIQNWMLSTLSVSNVLCESKNVYDRIQLESIPSGGEFLYQVIDAMKRNVRITIGYCKYRSADISMITVEPYCVKLFHRRWYVLCFLPERKVFRTYSFDRIKTLVVTDETFAMNPSFSAAGYFKNYYGIVSGDDSILEKVVLRAFEHEVYYMRDLPVHHSQKEIATGDNYSDFELYLCPTLDFVGHLLSRGAYIKVLEPAWLADKLLDTYEKSMNLYAKK